MRVILRNVLATVCLSFCALVITAGESAFAAAAEGPGKGERPRGVPAGDAVKSRIRAKAAGADRRLTEEAENVAAGKNAEDLVDLAVKLLSDVRWKALADIALDMLSGNTAEFLSGNKPALFSNNRAQLCSGNEASVLSDNQTALLSHNCVNLLSNVRLSFSFNVKGMEELWEDQDYGQGHGELTHRSRRIGRFRALDADNDGVLTLAEFQAARSGNRARRAHSRFAGLDKNNDGLLSLAELTVGKDAR